MFDRNNWNLKSLKKYFNITTKNIARAIQLTVLDYKGKELILKEEEYVKKQALRIDTIIDKVTSGTNGCGTLVDILISSVSKNDEEILPQKVDRQFVLPLYEYIFGRTESSKSPSVHSMFYNLLLEASRKDKDTQKNFCISNEEVKYIKNNFSVCTNSGIPCDSEISNLECLIEDTLSQGRELSKIYFQIISDKGRFKSYINTESERIIIKNKLKTSKNSEEYELSELVFRNENGNKCTDSISLHGIGGTGKTFQLLSLYDLLINSETSLYNSIIPFYLELNDIRSNVDNCILFELAKRLDVEIDILINILSEKGNNVILMLDGYNEVTNGELREEIAKRICDIRRNYKTRIVITSRLDHSDMFNRINRGETAVFTQAEIQPLSSSQVDEYFKKINVHGKFYNRLNKSEQRLVRTAQGLSMLGALLKKNTKKEIKNLGTLLHEYVNNIVLEDEKNTEFEAYLEIISYHMVLNGWFEITPNNLKRLLGDKYDKVVANSFIQKLLVVDSKGNFELTHQNFRDMYCAQYFNKLINKDHIIANINCFTTNNITTNNEILVLCGDLIQNDEDIQDSIKVLKDTSNFDYSFALSVLIKIYAFRNDNDIHKLNLNGLDLSKVSLSGYILYHKEYQEDENGKERAKTSHINLKDATVSEDTFETNGLKRGSSTICKYIKNGIEYIAAFCSDNLIIYNTNTTKWQSIRYQFKDPKKKFGWINCACHLEDKKKIILGTENGYITFFSYLDEPYINTNPDEFLKYNESCQHSDFKDGRSIQSIIQVKDAESSENILVASNSAGAIFILNTDKILIDTSEDDITQVRENFKSSDYNEKDFSVCKLVASDKYLFYSWGDKIFRQPFSKQCENFSEWIHLNQKCIFDIYCTDLYLFVNTGKKIIVISINTGEILDSYSYSKNEKKKDEIQRQDKINRFTKISNFENRPDKVLIGTSAADQDRNTVPNYIVLTVEVGEDEDGDEEFFIKHYPIFGIEQTMTTFSAVSFKQDSHTFIATTSNDRSIQILSVDMEDFKAIKHLGTYDGIHHIETISSKELLLSQYDGSVSHWKYNTKSQDWRCMDVYPIHHDWVWKTRYYVDDNNNTFFFSCSYDGTVKRTNMRTYETDTLIEDDDKIVDLALIRSDDKLSTIYAVTTHKIISYDYICEIRNKDIPFKDSDNLHEIYKGDSSYAIKSVSPGIGNYSDTSMIAVNFYANNNKELTDIARIYSVSDGKSQLVMCINPNNTNEFKDYIKINEIKTQGTSLIITGQKQNEKGKSEQTTVYSVTSSEQLNFEKIKSLSDLKERRIICITMQDKQIFIGCLDGSVFTLNYDDSLKESNLNDLTPVFLTHANLISIFPVKMEGVRWVDDRQKDSFKGYFKNI